MIIPNFSKTNWYNQVSSIHKLFSDLSSENENTISKLSNITLFISNVMDDERTDFIVTEDDEEHSFFKETYQALLEDMGDDDIFEHTFVYADDDPTDEVEGSSLSLRVHRNEDGKIICYTYQDESDPRVIFSIDFEEEEDSFHVIHNPVTEEEVQDVCQRFYSWVQQTKLFEVTIDLYRRGQLNVSNFIGTVQTHIGSISEKSKEIYQLIISSISDFINHGGFLAWIKTLWTRVTSIFSRNDKIFFPVAQTKVSTSLFLALPGVISIATTIVSIVVSMFKPIIGLLITGIGVLANKAIEAINDNTSDHFKYNSEANICGDNAYIQRSLEQYYGDNNSIKEYFDENSSEGVFSVSQGCFCTYIFNNAIYVEGRGNFYPTQTFIVPIIPRTSSAWFELLKFFSCSTGFRGNPAQSTTFKYLSGMSEDFGVSLSSGTFNPPLDYKTCFKNLCVFISENPDSFSYPDSTWDDQSYILGHSIGLSIYKCLTGEVPSSWGVSSYSGEKFNDVISLSKIRFYNIIESNSLSGNDIAGLTAICLWMYAAFRINNDKVQNILHSNLVSELTNIILYPGNFDIKPDNVNSGSYHSIPPLGDVFKPNAATLYNTSLSRVGIYNAAVKCYSNDIMYVENVDPTNTYNCVVVFPQSTVNIWVRLAVTIGAIAAAVATALITRKVLQMRARRVFMKRAALVQNSYNNWKTNTNADKDKALYKTYRKQQKKLNRYSSFWGLGSFDAYNGWFNDPTSSISVTGVSSGLSSLNTSGNDVADENYVSLVDIYNLIKSLY